MKFYHSDFVLTQKSEGIMKLSFLLTSILCLATVFAEAGFSNAGVMQSKNLYLTVSGTLDNSGQLIGTESATFSCDTITGKGLIKSPQIVLKAKLFAFKGTIECSGKCTITTSAPFDEKMFKRKGGGEFVIIHDPKMCLQLDANEYSITDDILLYVE